MDWTALSVGIAVMGMALSGLNIWVTLRIQLALSRMENEILRGRSADKEEMKRWVEDRFEPRRHHYGHAAGENNG